MRSSTIILALGIMATPVALLASPQSPGMTDGLLQMVQLTTSAPEQTLNGRPLTDAPVSGPIHSISPADRAGGAGSRDLNAGPVASLPFSAGPVSNLQAGSQSTPNGGRNQDTTPNLGR